MKIESGFSLVIASQPFQVLGCHGSWIIRAILDRSGPFSELKGPFRTILDRLDHFGQFWTHKKIERLFFHFLSEFLAKCYFPQKITLSGPNFGLLVENLECRSRKKSNQLSSKVVKMVLTIPNLKFQKVAFFEDTL